MVVQKKKILNVRRMEPVTTNIYSSYLLFLTTHLFKNIKCLRKQMHAHRIRRVIT